MEFFLEFYEAYQFTLSMECTLIEIHQCHDVPISKQWFQMPTRSVTIRSNEQSDICLNCSHPTEIPSDKCFPQDIRKSELLSHASEPTQVNYQSH